MLPRHVQALAEKAARALRVAQQQVHGAGLHQVVAPLIGLGFGIQLRGDAADQRRCLWTLPGARQSYRQIGMTVGGAHPVANRVANRVAQGQLGA